jgi:ABC-type transport system substrate-binding protein
VYFDEQGAWNYIHYDIQDLLERGRSETDPEARRAIYEEIQRKIAEDVPAIPLAVSVYTIAIQNYVKGMTPDLFRGYWAYEVYIEDH